MVDNIESGLKQIFNYQTPNAVTSGTTGTPSTKGTTSLTPAKVKLIAQANDLYTKALDAQKNLDWAKYGEYIKQLGNLLKQLNK